ncbi:MAG: SOS response-associated peptidase [Bacteroidetes bacterium]|nr:SOS response-associated peptidase [Bacteroidota bacterium]
MCSSYTSKSKMKKEEYELAYGAEWDKDDVDAKDTYTDESGKNTIGYPGITMPVITIDKPKIIQDYRFGFIAHWLNADKLNEVRNTFNARIETISELATWRDAWKNKQRCVVLTNGFYEHDKKRKIKVFFHLKETENFYYAGIYNDYINKKTGEIIKTMAIVTTTANELISEVHTRMPVMLRPGDEKLWMDKDADLNHLLIQYGQPLNASYIIMEDEEPKATKVGQGSLF